MMREVVITGAVRLPVGLFGGVYKMEKPDDLGAAVIKAAVSRYISDPNQVDRVIMGFTQQTSEAPNIARIALLKAGLPVEVVGTTPHINCGSGLLAINEMTNAIKVGDMELGIAGGIESLSRGPFLIRGTMRWGHKMGTTELIDALLETGINASTDLYGHINMGITAENLAKQYNISRQEQDEFALRSQKRAGEALKVNRFADEIVPYETTGKKKVLVEKDEGARPNTTLEELAKLPPVFMKGGSVTAGNSCTMNDGAAAVVLMSKEKADALGIRPWARILSHAVAGVHPTVMGIGPVPALKKALDRTRLNLNDLELIELNEAFAAQALACIKELNLDLNKVNVNGGAIALGHPIGATGAILMTRLLYEMKRRKAQFGAATLCIGGGLGIATIVEMLN